ncbi:unnamed protein product, partial [Phaeothamnion confervicola]
MHAGGRKPSCSARGRFFMTGIGQLQWIAARLQQSTSRASARSWGLNMSFSLFVSRVAASSLRRSLGIKTEGHGRQAYTGQDRLPMAVEPRHSRSRKSRGSRHTKTYVSSFSESQQTQSE